MIRHLGISGRLFLLAAALSLSLLGLGGYAFVQLHGVAHSADSIETANVPQLQRMARLELEVTRTSLQVRHAMLSRNDAERAAALADIGERRKRIEQTLAEYEKAIHSPQGHELFKPVPALVARFWTAGEATIKLIQQGQKAEAFAHLVDHAIPARNALLQGLTDTVKYQESALVERVKDIESEARDTLNWLLALVALATAALLLFSWMLGRLLRRRVASCQQVAARVSAGNLSVPVQDNQRDEFSPLLASLASMQQALVDLVGSVRSNADQVSIASTQIAQGNQDLSQRTEQQAGALQQTAATMDELAATVRNNADNASQAKQLALSASTVARSGGEVVTEVVNTMKAIDDSSKRIAEIIGTIDGIAFQTNILALNAAVEAARAGEQGRGFAVVASEVRNLAQRSAEAAREIKQLISTSVGCVSQGTALVGRAGSTMQEIVVAIQRVTDVASEISSASAEQSQGVGQVGQAVQQMDQATQQNSALVEESAAAAEHLRQQALHLVQAVSAFKLQRGAA